MIVSLELRLKHQQNHVSRNNSEMQSGEDMRRRCYLPDPKQVRVVCRAIGRKELPGKPLDVRIRVYKLTR